MTGLRERVLSRLIVDPSGCLLWTGARSSTGYGHVWAAGRLVGVHRLMYEWFVGPIPPGLQIDHLCRVTHCASPAHLEAVTPRENTLRGNSPAAHHARQMTCIHGHEFVDRISAWGRRKCLECDRLGKRRMRALEVKP